MRIDDVWERKRIFTEWACSSEAAILVGKKHIKRQAMDARYQQKLAFLFQSRENFTDPYQIPPEEWVDDPKKWPPVEFGQIYAYLIESPGLFTKEKLKAYKSLEAYNYYIRYAVHTKWLI